MLLMMIRESVRWEHLIVVVVGTHVVVMDIEEGVVAGDEDVVAVVGLFSCSNLRDWYQFHEGRLMAFQTNGGILLAFLMN